MKKCINPNRNPAWGLSQGDGQVYANATFNVKSGEMFKISAHYLCEGEEILIFEVDDAWDAECGTTLASRAEGCCGELKLDHCNQRGNLIEAGRYILARQTCDGEVLSPQAEVRVTKHKLKAGMPHQNTGFCC